MSRVYSAKIAALKASDEGLEVKGSVMASDAFLPFRDGLDSAAAVGITAVIQPGGSVRDEEVIAAATSTASPWCSPACGISATEWMKRIAGRRSAFVASRCETPYTSAP